MPARSAAMAVVGHEHELNAHRGASWGVVCRATCRGTRRVTRDGRWAMGASPPLPAHRNNTQLRIASGCIPMCIVRRVGENFGRRTRTHHHAAHGDAARAFCVRVAIPMVVIELKPTHKPAFN